MNQDSTNPEEIRKAVRDRYGSYAEKANAAQSPDWAAESFLKGSRREEDIRFFLLQKGK